MSNDVNCLFFQRMSGIFAIKCRQLLLTILENLGNYNQYCIPVIFQVASLLAALTHPGHIVIYAPGDSLPCRRDAS
ncbi:hypothetical protein C6H68_17980 [Photorhabdus luminescens]|nr:hypothetical protein C6H68_17980 [Photorhabdus luminescens]